MNQGASCVMGGTAGANFTVPHYLFRRDSRVVDRRPVHWAVLDVAEGAPDSFDGHGDLCQNTWLIACGVLAIVQLIALGYAAFGSRVLSRRSRVILAICGLVGSLTNPMLLILLLMPEIH
jgi:hypothetical protein